MFIKYLLICLLLFAGSAHAAERDFDAVKIDAEQGHAKAQLSLGFQYEQGVGVPEDDIQAYAWFSLASAQGYQDARDAKEILAGRMTRAQIAEAQKLSREYWEAFGPATNTQ